MRVVVVGGGVAGLAAAHALSRTPSVERVALLEASPRLGGHLATARVAGIAVDTAADRVHVGSPVAADLLGALPVRLETPATTDLAVLHEGRLRALPAGLVQGVPTDLAAVARSGLLDPRALARLPLDHVLPATALEPDVGIGRYVGERLGVQVVERITGPVVSATHGGAAVGLSLRALQPDLYEHARGERSLIAAVRRVVESDGREAPAERHRHLGVVGGMAHLVRLWRTDLERAGVEVRCGATVRGLDQRPGGWDLTVGPSGADAATVRADAVVLAVPAAAAARLLEVVALGAAVHLAELAAASVATVSVAYRRSDLTPPEGRDPLATAGFVVARGEPRRVLGATHVTTTWPWVAAQDADLAVVRVLLGGTEDVEVLQQPDDALVEHAVRELGFVLRTGRARPVDTHVARWGGALPQYAVGHVDRVAAVRESVAGLPGLAVCGATYDGTGIAACVGSAYRAVSDVLVPAP